MLQSVCNVVFCARSIHSIADTEYDDEIELSFLKGSAGRGGRHLPHSAQLLKCEQLERQRREALLQEVSKILKKWFD